MVKRALTLLTSILIALHLLMPFNIYADTITNSNVLGINSVLLSKSQNVAVTNSWYYIYQHTITLDANYIGTITLDVNLTYYAPSGSSSSYSTSTISNKTYFINGNTITINQTVSSDNYGNQGPIVSSSYLLKSSNVVKTSTITELQQIIDLLTNIYNSEDQIEGLLNNQLEQLELVVQNTSLANQYLEYISQLRQWNIPFESYQPNIYMMKNGFEIKEIKNYNYYQIPFYQIKHNDVLFQFYSAVGYTFQFIYFINANSSLSIVQNWYQLDDGKINNFKILDRFFDGSYYWTVYYFEISNFTKSGENKITYTNYDHLFAPILSSYISNNYSTDFALRYGLSNRLLDNLELIANGTTASQSAADSSQSANEQLQTDSNTLFQQENGFKSDMNNAMQNVNTTFRLQDMGTKFVSSAQWVRTQYEQLTNNTPFASLITFSLITGLALILLGKVYR